MEGAGGQDDTRVKLRAALSSDVSNFTAVVYGVDVTEPLRLVAACGAFIAHHQRGWGEKPISSTPEQVESICDVPELATVDGLDKFFSDIIRDLTARDCDSPEPVLGDGGHPSRVISPRDSTLDVDCSNHTIITRDDATDKVVDITDAVAFALEVGYQTEHDKCALNSSEVAVKAPSTDGS